MKDTYVKGILKALSKTQQISFLSNLTPEKKNARRIDYMWIKTGVRNCMTVFYIRVIGKELKEIKKKDRVPFAVYFKPSQF